MFQSQTNQILASALFGVLLGGATAMAFPKAHVAVPIAVTAGGYVVARVSIGVAVAPDSLVTNSAA